VNDKTDNQKRSDNEGHRVLISPSITGTILKKELVHQNATIAINQFQDAERLKHYDLIIMPFSEFEMKDQWNITSKDPYKDIFEKQALEALDEGTTFCFVHHNETTPGNFADFSTTGYHPGSEDAIDACLETQAGFRWIDSSKIRIGRSSKIFLSADVKRGEFGTFLKKWGASYNCFRTFGDAKFDDILYSADEITIGFSICWSRGVIVYLPFQANENNRLDFKNSLLCLVDSLLTYKAKRVRELPEWAKVPLFESETKLAAEKSSLLELLEAVDGQIVPYEEAKSLLVSNEHDLEVAVPGFISSKLGILTDRNEKFVEDFWILNNKNERKIICEVKSVTKGFKKNAIYDLFNHRERHDLAETFPAVLFVNCNLQAGSWAKKDVPIQKNDFKIAAKHHVLIVRIEDLVQIWNSLMTKTLKVDMIMNVFTTGAGWLECKGGKLIVHKA